MAHPIRPHPERSRRTHDDCSEIASLTKRVDLKRSRSRAATPFPGNIAEPRPRARAFAEPVQFEVELRLQSGTRCLRPEVKAARRSGECLLGQLFAPEPAAAPRNESGGPKLHFALALCDDSS